MCDWIPITECIPADDYVVIVAWYNHQKGRQYVTEAQLTDGRWMSEQAPRPGDEVTHWAHFPDAPPIEDVLACRWQRNRSLLKKN